MTDAVRDIERRRLNIIEALILTSILGVAGSVLMLREAVVKLQVTQETTNKRLDTLQSQQADVQSIARQMAEVKVRVDRHDEDLRELRNMKGLK